MDDQTAQTPADKSEGVVDVSFKQSDLKKKLIVTGSAVVCIVLGVALGYMAAAKSVGAKSVLPGAASITKGEKTPPPSLRAEDVRDSAEGVIKIKPDKDKHIQGSHILQRDDSPWPVYLISNLVDLTQYENKHVKVSGFTYGCGPSIWCLEVNKVEQK